VLLCPGKAADTLHGGGQPIIVEGGAVVRETWSVTATITLDQDLETYNETAVRLELAALYGVPPSWIQLQATAGSLVLAVTIAPPPSALSASAAGTPLATSAADVEAAVNGADALTLTTALGATASNTVASRSSATVGVECPAGHFSPGSGICLKCAPGTMASGSGSDPCADCTGGTYTDETGATECKGCTAGHFCPDRSSAPIACPKGTWSNFTRLATQGGCISCPAGSFCGAGAGEPTPCPKETHGGGQTGLSSVFCNGNTYNEHSEHLA